MVIRGNTMIVMWDRIGAFKSNPSYPLTAAEVAQKESELVKPRAYRS